jgi:hypothetical protein
MQRILQAPSIAVATALSDRILVIKRSNAAGGEITLDLSLPSWVPDFSMPLESFFYSDPCEIRASFTGEGRTLQLSGMAARISREYVRKGLSGNAMDDPPIVDGDVVCLVKKR